MRRFLNERTWDAAVLAFNAVLVLVFFLVFWNLWGRSSSHLADAGGMPPLTRAGLSSLFDAGQASLPRLADWGLSWVYGVFAVGALILTVSGVRYMVVAVKRFL